MAWPIDELKLARVRERMAEDDLDVLVVRAIDNIVYLSSFWSIKGYDALLFPREGPAILVVTEPQRDDAERMSWADRIVDYPGYDPRDPRPPQQRLLDVCGALLREHGWLGAVGLELSQSTQAVDRMVGEPTTWSKLYYDFFDDRASRLVDATLLLAELRMVKTDQEIERMRLANRLAYEAMEHVSEVLEPGMRTSEVAAAFEGHVHSRGMGYDGKVELARAFTLVWSGSNIRTFTATGDALVAGDEPTLLEIWVCADGYWTDLTKNLCPGTLNARYDRLLDGLLEIYGEAVAFVRDGADLAALDGLMRSRIADLGFPGQPSHPVCHGIGARAHEPPYAHQAAPARAAEGMVLAVEPGVYFPEGGGLRLEDAFLVGTDEATALCGFPDDFRVLA